MDNDYIDLREHLLITVTKFYDDIGEEQRRIDEANKKVIRLILRTAYPGKPRLQNNGSGR